jgi:multifunctional methyltransferase subunit TRM112
MRLLTHNSLKSPVKDVAKGYPMHLEIGDMEIRESEVNLDFVKGLIPGLDWEGILVAAEAVGLKGMPSKFNTAILEDESFLRAAHNLLLDVHIKSGTLICPESGKRFPIVDEVPNLMMIESELATGLKAKC